MQTCDTAVPVVTHLVTLAMIWPLRGQKMSLIDDVCWSVRWRGALLAMFIHHDAQPSI